MDLNERPSGDKITEETKILISSLPSDADGVGEKLCNYQGCWYYYNTLQGVLNFQSGFQPQDTDIILASFPKSGTTWLKALTVALLERSKNHSSDDDHLLLSDNPHGIVPFFEIDVFHESSSPDLSKFSSFPRLFSTHMPLHTMKLTLKDSPCKIVYICRDVKDTLISWWFFVCAMLKVEPKTSILESIYKSFCSGTIYYGPIWEHKHVLFMRYEEIKAEPCDQIKRLADFLGYPFTKEEEENRLVEKILDLCSLRSLSGMEVNKTGKRNNLDYKDFFRKGEVGDWKNYLTPEMENKIDMIIQEKFQDADGEGKKLCKYQGCWYYYNALQGVLNFQRGFQPQDTDIILASYPKSGTTWLKALTVSLLERSKNHSSDDQHPLLSDNPHGIVPFLESNLYESSSPNLAKFSSVPRLFSTHLPLDAMQETLKDSPCKIVYVCRNVKDTLVSWWFFVCAIHKIEPDRSILESLFKSFCNGTIYYGPFWDHLLSYWRGSLEDPKHVLFMRNNLDHKDYFRKGEVGDWKNHLTPEMENKLDMIIQEKLKGSGLKF
ncbi:unnamed protein product, partial [Thlaspi arvense]